MHEIKQTLWCSEHGMVSTHCLPCSCPSLFARYQCRCAEITAIINSVMWIFHLKLIQEIQEIQRLLCIWHKDTCRVIQNSVLWTLYNCHSNTLNKARVHWTCSSNFIYCMCLWLQAELSEVKDLSYSLRINQCGTTVSAQYISADKSFLNKETDILPVHKMPSD